MTLLLCYGLRLALRKRVYRDCVNALAEKRYNDFNKIILSWKKYLFSPLEFNYIILNAGFLKEDANIIKRQFEEILNFKLNTKMKQEILMNYFIFEIEENNIDKATSLLHEIETINEDMFKIADIEYDIAFNNGNKYLAQILDQYSSSSGDKRNELSIMSYRIYTKQNNPTEARKYQIN